MSRHRIAFERRELDIFCLIEHLVGVSYITNMLTKADLKEVKNAAKEGTRNILTAELRPLRKDVSELKSDLKDVKKDILKMRKDIDIIISLFDSEYLNLRERIERIENHLQLPPIS